MLKFTNHIEFKKEFIIFKIYLKKLTKNIASVLFSIVLSLGIMFSTANLENDLLNPEFSIFIALIFATIFTGFDLINNFENYLSPVEDKNIYQTFVLQQITYKRIFTYRILLTGLFIFSTKLVFILLLIITYKYFKIVELSLFLILAFICSILSVLFAVNTAIKHYQHDLDYEIIKTKTSMYILIKFFLTGFVTFIFTILALLFKVPSTLSILIIIIFYTLLTLYQFYLGSINNVYN